MQVSILAESPHLNKNVRPEHGKPRYRFHEHEMHVRAFAVPQSQYGLAYVH